MKILSAQKTIWIWILLISLALWFAYPILRVVFFLITDPIPENQIFTLSETHINDASGLNETIHSGIIKLNSDLNKSILQLTETLNLALSSGKKMIPIGARHSMGKQSIERNAIHIDLSHLNGMKLEEGLLRVQAGATWEEVLQFLAPLGLSVQVMQSNADFSVGGSISVNAHGWQPDRPPISSTVSKFTLFTPEGEIIICNRIQNSKLFRHALGGYGLMGIILEVWIKPVPNEILRSSHKVIHFQDFTREWNKMKESPVRLAFGRLLVAKSTFFEQILLSTYETTGQISNEPTEYRVSFKNSLARAIFRASLNSQRGKSFRQWMENLLGGESSGIHARADLLMEPVRVFANNRKGKTDVLVEVFIPQERFATFIPDAKKIFSNQNTSLLNVTVREINQDIETALSYAKTKVFGLVMLFTIDQTKKAEKRLQSQINELIKRTLLYGGTFYLPYRNYANSAQLTESYPELKNFLSYKKEWDPQEIFSSGFYRYIKRSIQVD